MKTTDPELIALLAEQDSLFEPIRDWRSDPRVAGILERRQEFHRKGVPYLVGGTGAERIEGHREANEFGHAEKVKFGWTRRQRSHWRLTLAEYWRLRWWCLLTGEAELVRGMASIAEHERKGLVYRGSRLVPEFALCGSRFDKAGILLVEEVLLPGLVHGWLESQSDTEGRVYYGLTWRGDKFLADWTGPTFEPPAFNLVEATRAAEIYRSACRAARDSFAAGSAGEHRHVAVPLSCGCVPRDVPGCVPLLDPTGAIAS